MKNSISTTKSLTHILSKPISFSKSVSSQEVSYFLENLSTLVSSGYDVYTAITVIADDTQSSNLKTKLNEAIALLSDGVSVWKALSQTNIVTENITNLLRVGEDSGRLAEHLHVIAEQESRDRMFKEKIQSAMMYPLFVCAVMLIVGVGVSWFILPKLAQIFTSLRANLPFSTRILIGFGKFLGSYGVIAIPILCVVLVVLGYILFVNKKTRHIGLDIMFYIPGLSKVFRDIELSRFGFLMSSLLQVGIPIPQALDIIADSTNFSKLKKAYSFLKNSVDEGKSFREAFTEKDSPTNVIPMVVQQLIFAGEESFALPEVFLKIYTLYESRIEQSTKNLAVILEPVLLVIIAGGVFFVAIAVITPIYSLVGNIQSPQQKVMAPTTVKVENPPKQLSNTYEATPPKK